MRRTLLILILLVLGSLACTITTIGGSTPTPTPTVTQAVYQANPRIVYTVQAQTLTGSIPGKTPTPFKQSIQMFTPEVTK